MNETQELINKLCLKCGKIFSSKLKGDAQFCGSKCGYFYRRKNGISKRGKYYKTTCFICEKPFFYTKNEKELNIKHPCCSKKCANRLPEILLRGKKRNGILADTSCKNCGNKILDYWHRHRKFCSKKCYDAFRLKKRIVKNCLTCGKKFSRPPSEERIFCSKKCILERGITWISKKCPNCTKIFKHPKGHPISCCSVKCAGEYRGKKKK